MASQVTVSISCEQEFAEIDVEPRYLVLFVLGFI